MVDSEICGSVGTETGPVCNLSSKDFETLIYLDLPGWKTQAFREMGKQDGGSRRGKTALIQLWSLIKLRDLPEELIISCTAHSLKLDRTLDWFHLDPVMPACDFGGRYCRSSYIQDTPVWFSESLSLQWNSEADCFGMTLASSMNYSYLIFIPDVLVPLVLSFPDSLG